ncbi:hypothetical protein BATDEDRAFT_89301 [Batrachochytrium dendrobatidis JAM81]|uniref:tRNA(His) guanylyltransferase n=1 Tax=Batrachochytrium dendrobatidis (strain JAM81 / FGSC 10211) TaxID=684364 RepID=F4P4D6_BATDJ|nr:uncharacterized protein BATDEDRAFT_89301 [Batrachochytrium dendrobatidis JAM81]EGF79904.1 hypothetical protein BATDEDRAFT_89301 [Batrachochytrium dendrobatidis JAM81]|eukprot:XP_006679721.1 hypothetical protein BATDEDRAFT_89301 [Batrachochytrium dendrobatidis JAM81]
MTLPKSAQDALVYMYESKVQKRLKELEVRHDIAVAPTEHYMIRIDGVAFHTFTKGVEQPFDSRITRAMVETTKDLVDRFGSITAYTQSDEISLVFSAAELSESSPYLSLLQSATSDKRKVKRQRGPSDSSLNPDAAKTQVGTRVHSYNGRIQKLASTTASYASARFNYHISTPASQWDSLSSLTVRQRMLSHLAFFDARVIPLTDLQDASETIFWRSNFDGMRNAISHISQSNFKKSLLHGKSVRDQCAMLAEAGVDIMGTYGCKPLFGTWVKKEKYFMKDAINPKTGEPVLEPVLRTRLRCGSFNWADWSEDERLTFTASKYWPTDERAPPMDSLD